MVQDPESRSGELSCTGRSWGLDPLSRLSKVRKNRILAGPGHQQLGLEQVLSFVFLILASVSPQMQRWIPKDLLAVDMEPHTTLLQLRPTSSSGL